jgi:hypothetical protein
MGTSISDSNDPWDLAIAHKYAEALVIYDRKFKGRAPDALDVANRATVLLCLNRLREALAGFLTSEKLSAVKKFGMRAAYHPQIATINWLLGARENAVRVMYESVNGVADGTIAYADMAGGVSEGLLLWYFGVSFPDNTTRDDALKYLHDRSRLCDRTERPRIKYWPGPLAEFALGMESFDSVLIGEFGTNDVETIKRRAQTDLLARRRLTMALFYLGTWRRSRSDEQGCRAAMRECAGLVNPVLECEWYLARREISHRTGSTRARKRRS